MQNELLDIVIIGSLALLFASTYRRRATPMVRFWTLGWILILVHFAALLLHPSALIHQRELQLVCFGALVACGVSFLLAASDEQKSLPSRMALPVIAGAAEILYILVQAWDVKAQLPYLLAILAGTAAWLVYSVRLRSASRMVRSLLIATTIASTAWLCWGVAHQRQDVGISAILCQIYLSNGLIYSGRLRRVSGGAVTVVFGLLAWAAVFPAGEFCDHLGIFSRISPELWNVPKYFVAFGMILVLLEDEIAAAGAATKHYRLLFETNPHPMWIYDLNTLAFQSVNDSALTQYGYSRQEFLGMTLNDLRPLDEMAGPDEIIGATPELQTLGPRRHRRKDGSVFFVDVATHRMQNAGREAAFSLVQDITERQELHERLFHQANHDLLTGIPNRAWIDAKLRETLVLAGRQLRKAALLCLDIDRFKQINDSYGHAVGDICLQEVAKRLELQARAMAAGSAVARIGGEEFILLLPDVASRADAEQAASGLLDALQAPVAADGYLIELTASIGIAFYPDDGKDSTALWRNADGAMYRAKRAGGNQFLCMSPEISLLASEANELDLQLRRALRAGGLELHYQPLYKINGDLHSLEALVRLRDPERGMISPARFVPVAEESGLIVPLGNWVLNEVCRQSAEWQRVGLALVPVAVNISPLQITRPDFAGHVTELLALHGLNPHLLGMEITETAMMRNTSEASRQMKILADLGIGFSVDDFGTGYSSLGQLDKLPAQSLKIDRTFIRRMCWPEGTYSIVDAVISMAHSLRLEVVAEGVETQEQWSCLRLLGCDLLQGFLFSRPVPASDVPALLQLGKHFCELLPRQEEDIRVA